MTELVIPLGHRVHWFRVLGDLAEIGLSARGLARELQLAERTVQMWRNGAHPRHADGERVLALWCERLGRIRADVPTVSEFDHRA